MPIPFLRAKAQFQRVDPDIQGTEICFFWNKDKDNIFGAGTTRSSVRKDPVYMMRSATISELGGRFQQTRESPATDDTPKYFLVIENTSAARDLWANHASELYCTITPSTASGFSTITGRVKTFTPQTSTGCIRVLVEEDQV